MKGKIAIGPFILEAALEGCNPREMREAQRRINARMEQIEAALVAAVATEIKAAVPGITVDCTGIETKMRRKI